MGDGAPTLALFNFLWAAFYPLAYVGLMVLMERDVKKLTAANYLDGVIATLVTAAALVLFAFHPIAVASGGGTEFAAVNIVYPLGDLLLLGLTLFGVALLPPRESDAVVSHRGGRCGQCGRRYRGLVQRDRRHRPGVVHQRDGVARVAAA